MQGHGQVALHSAIASQRVLPATLVRKLGRSLRPGSAFAQESL